MYAMPHNECEMHFSVPMCFAMYLLWFMSMSLSCGCWTIQILRVHNIFFLLGSFLRAKPNHQYNIRWNAFLWLYLFGYFQGKTFKTIHFNYHNHFLMVLQPFQSFLCFFSHFRFFSMKKKRSRCQFIVKWCFLTFFLLLVNCYRASFLLEKMGCFLEIDSSRTKSQHFPAINYCP